MRTNSVRFPVTTKTQNQVRVSLITLLAASSSSSLYYFLVSASSSSTNAANVHVNRLQDYPVKDLAPKSLQALGILVSSADLSQAFNPMDLSAFVPALQADATVHVCVTGEDGSTSDLQPIHTAFLLAGLK